MTGHVYLLTRDQKLLKEVETSLPENVELTTSDEAKSANGADAVLIYVDSLGISALNRLKNESFIIIVTAQKGARYLIESMTFGAFDCIFRPVDRSTLLETLGRAIGVRAELESNLIKFPGEI